MRHSADVTSTDTIMLEMIERYRLWKMENRRAAKQELDDFLDGLAVVYGILTTMALANLLHENPELAIMPPEPLRAAIQEIQIKKSWKAMQA